MFLFTFGLFSSGRNENSKIQCAGSPNLLFLFLSLQTILILKCTLKTYYICLLLLLNVKKQPLIWGQSKAAGQEVDAWLQLILNIHDRRIAQKRPGFVQKAKLCQTLIKIKTQYSFYKVISTLAPVMSRSPTVRKTKTKQKNIKVWMMWKWNS